MGIDIPHPSKNCIFVTYPTSLYIIVMVNHEEFLYQPLHGLQESMFDDVYPSPITMIFFLASLDDTRLIDILSYDPHNAYI
jgi:hypothetical protein